MLGIPNEKFDLEKEQGGANQKCSNLQGSRVIEG
jgi:hypothetical protein